MTWSNAWFNAPCRTWAGKAAEPVKVTGRQAPPILLINETHDAATPYAGSLEVRRLFPKSVLIEGVGGTTHAGSLSGVRLHGRQDRRLPRHRCAARPREPGQPLGRAVRPGAPARPVSGGVWSIRLRGPATPRCGAR